MRRPFAAILLVAADCPSSPGGIGEPQQCTLVGCMDGLSVRLPAAPAGAWRVQVTDVATGATRTYDCPATSQCGSVAFFAEFTPARARVRVTTVGGSRDADVQPAYAESRPNGPDCPPVCRQAAVEVPLPA